MSQEQHPFPLPEELVAQRIKVGDKFNEHVVTEKVWTRDSFGQCRVHIVYIDGDSEVVMELEPNILFTGLPGLVSTNEVYFGKRVQTHYRGGGNDWTVTETHAELVDITKLKS
ncbi:hypothetical protein [Pseudomonas sp. NPDC089406]|uniref:hypothetical protein n=1 Tax=Pseudomonas sp. NPDC089406 TaxID=3364463 RepID=UPI00384D73CB